MPCISPLQVALVLTCGPAADGGPTCFLLPASVGSLPREEASRLLSGDDASLPEAAAARPPANDSSLLAADTVDVWLSDIGIAAASPPPAFPGRLPDAACAANGDAADSGGTSPAAPPALLAPSAGSERGEAGVPARSDSTESRGDVVVVLAAAATAAPAESCAQSSAWSSTQSQCHSSGVSLRKGRTHVYQCKRCAGKSG